MSVVFCSMDCRDAYFRVGGNLPSITQTDLIDGLNHPIVNGWKLWGRSLKTIVPYMTVMTVICFVVGYLSKGWTSPRLGGGDYEQMVEKGGLLHVWVFLVAMMTVFFAPGIAISQVLLSRSYTGLVHGNPSNRGRTVFPFNLALLRCLACPGNCVLL